jgi:AraC-like DNA-binding protein/mannose-6-phosphate isomerase-like protein (cupin superfamily)
MACLSLFYDKMSKKFPDRVIPSAPYGGVPRPVVALASDYPAGSRVAPHRHDRAQLVFASAGVMAVTTAAGTWVVPPQRAVWVPAATSHEIRMHGAVSLRSLYVEPEAAAGLPAACRVITVSPLLRELILRAMEIPARYDQAGPDGRVMTLILDELRLSAAAPLYLPRPSDRRLLRVTEALLEDPGDRRPLTAWAKQAGASPRTLARLFAQETGLGFRAWRQQARLLQALVGLAAGRPVTVLALDLGYDSPSAFVAAFKRAFGVTPARYFSED